jgi:hypothetical protein
MSKRYAKLIFLLLLSFHTLAVERFQLNEADVDETHAFLSHKIITFAETIDSFFGEYVRTDKKNKTRLVIESYADQKESRSVDTDTKAKIKLNLPHLQELFKFRNTRRGSIGKPVANEDDDEDGKSVTSKVVDDQYASDFFLKWKLSTQVGVDVDLSPDAYLRFNKKVELHQSKWIFRLMNDIYIYGRTGLGDDLTFEVDRLISKYVLFRFENVAAWSEKTSDVNYTHGPTLYYSLGEKRKLSASLKANAMKVDDHIWTIDNYTISLDYSFRPLRNWILLSTGPYITYARQNDFKSELAYQAKIEIFVGSY